MSSILSKGISALSSLPIPLLALLLAVVASFLEKKGKREKKDAATSREKIMLLVTGTKEGKWVKTVLSATRNSKVNLEVNVLLVCKELSELEEAKRNTLPRNVKVVVALAKDKTHPCSRASRLIKKYVCDEDEVVAIAEEGCIFLPGWDDVVLSFLPKNGILTCPTASKSGAATFPRLRQRSNGSAARDDSLSFPKGGEGCERGCVPSVCWCGEFSVASGKAWRKWKRMEYVRKGETYSEVRRGSEEERGQEEAPLPSVQCYVPLLPVLSHDSKIEESILDDDEGRKEGEEMKCDPPSVLEVAGLSRRASHEERVAKYGSIVASRIAVKKASTTISQHPQQ